jgi:Asp-tRNA(Asn)/Glu-tRNA(Gln) amidotransferase A subunit family amidase
MPEACLAQGLFEPVDRVAQLAAWPAVYQLGVAWSQ